MKIRISIVFLLIVLVGAGIFNFLQKSKSNDIKKLSDEMASSIETIYETAINTYKFSAQKEYYYLLNNKEAMRILKDFKKASFEEKKILRGELYRLYAKHYAYLRTLGVRQFHFHTHEGKSLLRFHIPHSNGDPLIDIRYSIRTANTKFKPVYGYEGGKIYPGFRYLFPIISDNQHLGSIEYSVSFEAIEKIIRDTFPSFKYHMHLDKSISYDKVFKWHRDYFEASVFGNGHYIENRALSAISNKIKDDPVITKINKEIKNQDSFSEKFNRKESFGIPLILENKGYIISFLSIKDTTNIHAAYLITYAQNDELIKINDKYKIFYFLFFFTIFTILVLAYIINFQIEKIVKQNKKLEETNVTQVETIIEQKNELETIFNTTTDGIVIIDFNSNFLFFNQAFENMLNLTKDELKNITWLHLVHSDEKNSFSKLIKQIKKVEHFENIEIKMALDEKEILSLNISMALMPDKKRVLISAKDISENKRKEKLINDYLELVDKNIITSATDLEGNIAFVSDAFCKVSGYTKDELIGKSHNIIRDPNTTKKVYENMWGTINVEKVWRGELRNKRKDGTFYWVSLTISPTYNENNEIIGYTAINQDITDRKKIEEISITDALTKIYNRRYFNEIFPRILNGVRRNNDKICFLILDIDYFKQYNDTYGHQKGDEVLIKVASVIKHFARRADDYAFRLGGEEFGIIFKAEDETKSISFANSLLKEIEELKIEHKGSKVSSVVTASLGLMCTCPHNIKDEVELYREADKLLYTAKKEGRNRVCSRFCEQD